MNARNAFYVLFLCVFAVQFSANIALAQPPNDLCQNAIEVFDGVTAYDNIGANTDGPAFSCAPGNSDVWFIYTASCTGDVLFSLCNNGAQPPTDFDTVMQVYDTGSCANLGVALSQCDDDGCEFAGPSFLFFPVEFGNQYIVRLGGWGTGPTQGNGHLEIVPQGNCVVPIDTIILSPPDAVNEVLTSHTVTALAEKDLAPVADVFIQFEVTSGPNSGLISIPNNGECVPNDCRTDSNGEVSWTYSSDVPGTDTIVAVTGDMGELVVTSNSVTKTWIVLRNVPTISEWGLIALAGIFGIIGLIVLRKRRARA